MENWQFALVLLLAIFIGAMMPVFFQLAGLLRESKNRLRATGERLDDALDELRVALIRVNRIAGGLDGSEHEVAALVETVGELNQVLRNITTTAKVASAAGAAIGPAVVAAIRVLRENGHAAPNPFEGAESGVASESMPSEDGHTPASA